MSVSCQLFSINQNRISWALRLISWMAFADWWWLECWGITRSSNDLDDGWAWQRLNNGRPSYLNCIREALTYWLMKYRTSDEQEVNYARQNSWCRTANFTRVVPAVFDRQLCNNNDNKLQPWVKFNFIPARWIHDNCFYLYRLWYLVYFKLGYKTWFSTGMQTHVYQNQHKPTDRNTNIQIKRHCTATWKTFNLRCAYVSQMTVYKPPTTHKLDCQTHFLAGHELGKIYMSE